MSPPLRVAWARGEPPEALVTREWLVANGLGGYACGTLGGVTTRRFHGLLVAALPAPHGRTMIVNRLDEEVAVGGGAPRPLEGTEPVGDTCELPDVVAEVRLERGLPVWRYEVDGAVIEKRIAMPHARNTTVIAWRVVASPAPVVLRLRPALHVRPHEGRLAMEESTAYAVDADAGGWRVAMPGGVPALSVRVHAGRWRATLDARRSRELEYREEKCRGYDHAGALASPGEIAIDLAAGDEAALVLTVEDGDRARCDPRAAYADELARRAALLEACDPRAKDGVGAELVLAADAFVIRPGLRRESDDHARTVIAGYHWFTDWGRDTMISLEGLALLTGRRYEARHILKTFAGAVKDGLLPNMFPEGESEGLYHTADATMWLFHAIDRYVQHTGDRETLRALLPTLGDIVAHHVRGTRFGIHVDEKDDLLAQGAEGYQLTWMDAKVDGWVVTPRRGKAVEINALWFNALCVLAQWLRAEGDLALADAMRARAERVRVSFNRRFWNDAGGYLFDVVDGERGDDDALRPNQVLAVSLPNPVLDRARWPRVVDVVRETLVTPVGLRSLAPGHRDYARKYDGDLRARDAAYHQGTVWGWLVGPFVDAWLRVHPDDARGARRIVEGLAPHLGEACVGSISEIFDAEAPYLPRGCVAQAWSVAEALRAWVRSAT